MADASNVITDLAMLERLYGAPSEASIVKEVDHVHPVYRTLIEAAPFAVLATNGPGGLDASPRGDGPGFVTVEDAKT
ncbi:MAG: pyridoxamine 5'-phosphate oxidase family protein, partial [Stellaceae bacterium]